MAKRKGSYDETLASFDVRRPWVQALLLLACIPLFPEYIAPLLAIGAFFCAKRDAARRHQRIRFGTAGVIMLLYLAYMTIHLLWAKSLLISTGTVLLWLIMFLSYLTLLNILIDRQRIEVLLLTVSLVAGILGLLACFQYVLNALLGQAIPLQMWDFVDKQVYALFPFSVSLHSLGIRAAATFSNPNIFAEFSIMLLPFVAAYAFTGERSAAKIISRLSLLFIVMGVLFTFSRGCYLAIGAIAVVMCIANIRRLVPILIVGASVVLLIPETVYERLLSVGSTSDVSILERFDVWGISLQLFLERPLSGYGAGVGAVWDRLSQNGIGAPHAHNVFIEWLAEGGAVALILLLFLIWKLFRIGFELIMNTHRTRMYGAAIIAFCAGFAVCGMFDYPLFTPKLIGVFMMVLALIDALGHVELRRPLQSISGISPLDRHIGLLRRLKHRKKEGESA